MLTEDYCGICPLCGFDRMLVRYGSGGWFQYDACPRCGFGHGENGWGEPGLDNLKLWDEILIAEAKSLRAGGFPATREGALAEVMALPPPVRERDQVFRYTREHLARAAGELVLATDVPPFSLLGGITS